MDVVAVVGFDCVNNLKQSGCFIDEKAQFDAEKLDSGFHGMSAVTATSS